MLVRLQNAMGREDLIEQVLLSTPRTRFSEQAQSNKSVNIIVGYNSSPKSHTALDLALLIAHQTNLATLEQVTVQVVYVLEDKINSDYEDMLLTEEGLSSRLTFQIPLYFPTSSPSRRFATRRILSQMKLHSTAHSRRTSVEEFAQAELILRQAICLAEEWKSSFKAHLRFGCVTTELKTVIESENASLLILGCDSPQHPIVQQLGSNFPCAVMGIPVCVEDIRS